MQVDLGNMCGKGLDVINIVLISRKISQDEGDSSK